MINVLKNPIFLMLISVGLWMLYPFISNKTVEDLGVFPFAFLAHSCAAIAMVVVSLSFGLIEQIKKLCVKDLSPVMFPTIVSGFLIGINHLFLYWALDTTSNLDVIATLIFEIWPILFFFIDSRLRRGERHISMYKIAYSGLAFSGVLVLSLPGFLSSTIDSSSIFTVATLSGLGGLAMAFNCYFRMKCMEAWARIEESNKSISLGIFKRGMLTEMFVRVMAAPILFLAFLLSGASIPQLGVSDFAVILFVGAGILAFGSLLYDLAIFKSTSSAIGIMWYLVPIGSAFIIAGSEGRFLSGYEITASIIIIFANYKISK